jgi:hypothetical protein
VVRFGWEVHCEPHFIKKGGSFRLQAVVRLVHGEQLLLVLLEETAELLDMSNVLYDRCFRKMGNCVDVAGGFLRDLGKQGGDDKVVRHYCEVRGEEAFSETFGPSRTPRCPVAPFEGWRVHEVR